MGARKRGISRRVRHKPWGFWKSAITVGTLLAAISLIADVTEITTAAKEYFRGTQTPHAISKPIAEATIRVEGGTRSIIKSDIGTIKECFVYPTVAETISLLRYGKLEPALEVLEDLQTKIPNDNRVQANLLIVKANLLLERKNLKAAAEAAKAAYDRDPNYPLAAEYCYHLFNEVLLRMPRIETPAEIDEDYRIKQTLLDIKKKFPELVGDLTSIEPKSILEAEGEQDSSSLTTDNNLIEFNLNEVSDMQIGSATGSDVFSFELTGAGLDHGFPVGSTTVTWTATDSNGNNMVDPYEVTVVDTYTSNNYENDILIAVGIDDYSDYELTSDLKYAVSDARRISKTFSDIGYDNILFANDAAQPSELYLEIVDQSIRLSELGTGSRKLGVYISGHGFVDSDGDRFVLASKADGLTQLISLDIIEELLTAFQRESFLIVDACMEQLDIQLKRPFLQLPDSTVRFSLNDKFDIKPKVFYSSSRGQVSIESDVYGGGIGTYVVISNINKYLKTNKSTLDFNKEYLGSLKNARSENDELSIPIENIFNAAAVELDSLFITRQGSLKKEQMFILPNGDIGILDEKSIKH